MWKSKIIIFFHFSVFPTAPNRCWNQTKSPLVKAQKLLRGQLHAWGKDEKIVSLSLCFFEG